MEMNLKVNKMRELDDQTIERIIEQITHQVLILIQDGQAMPSAKNTVRIITTPTNPERMPRIMKAGISQ